MKCPVDGETLVITDRAGVEIDQAAVNAVLANFQ